MSDIGGKIYLPTSIGEVSELLSENINDLAKLCVSENINKFSRAKPIDVGVVRPITEAERRRANNGLVIPRFGSLSSLREAVLSGAVKWAYIRPSSRFRLTDFDRYNHDISAWSLDTEGCAMFNGVVLLDSDDGYIYSGTTITLWVDYVDADASDSPLLYPSDWDETSQDNLRAYRLGLALVNTETSDVWFRGNAGTLAENFIGLSAIVPPSVANYTTWIVVPLLTDRETDFFVTTEASANYIPLEGTYLSAYKYAENPSDRLEYSGEGEIQENGIELTISLKNNTASAITTQELYLVISSEEAYDSSWHYVEVAANTWLVDNKLDESLPEPGGALYDSLGKVCQRFYKLIDTMREQLGSLTIPAYTTAKFSFTIPSLGDDYGNYDGGTYDAILSRDTKSSYDVTEFGLSISVEAKSCFANGLWLNASPWTNDLGWDNTV